MRDDDRQYLLTVALEMRLLARARVLDGTAALSPARMTAIAEQLERIGGDAVGEARGPAPRRRGIGRG